MMNYKLPRSFDPRRAADALERYGADAVESVAAGNGHPDRDEIRRLLILHNAITIERRGPAFEVDVAGVRHPIDNTTETPHRDRIAMIVEELRRRETV